MPRLSTECTQSEGKDERRSSRIFLCNNHRHAIALQLRKRGWKHTHHFCEATVVLATERPPPAAPRVHQWVWLAICPPLTCKAHLFERLEQLALRSNIRRRWPETWILRSNGAVTAWRAESLISYTLPTTTHFFVKHPRTSGGTGTFPAGNVEAARIFAKVLMVACHAVVIQRAVDPAILPIGPSIFELRVWALLRRTDCWLFECHRAKTAVSGLMNRKVQRDLDSFGRFYSSNIASEATVRDALEGNTFDTRTKPDIAAVVGLVHDAIWYDLPYGTLAFVGFDFIVDHRARAWLIEANVKPPLRYADLAAQFPSELVRSLADCAILDLARIFEGKSRPNHLGPAWIKLQVSAAAP